MSKQPKFYEVLVNTGTGKKVMIKCSKDLKTINISHCKFSHQAWTKQIMKNTDGSNQNEYNSIFDDLMDV